ncbi:hypothetical protein DY000_02012842 [Brassica cretica]|nr:hypothetical protein DY000_02012842 [Brassica cretica]
MWLPCDVTCLRRCEYRWRCLREKPPLWNMVVQSESVDEGEEEKISRQNQSKTLWHSGSQIEPSKKDDYLNGVLAFTRTIGDCELKTADSFHCPPLHL